MTDENAKLARGIRVNRILLVIILLLFLCIIAGIVAVGLYAYNMSQQMLPLVRKFGEIDWTLMSDRISRLNPAELTDKIDNIEADVSAIKEALATFH